MTCGNAGGMPGDMMGGMPGMGGPMDPMMGDAWHDGRYAR